MWNIIASIFDKILPPVNGLNKLPIMSHAQPLNQDHIVAPQIKKIKPTRRCGVDKTANNKFRLNYRCILLSLEAPPPKWSNKSWHDLRLLSLHHSAALFVQIWAAGCQRWRGLKTLPLEQALWQSLISKRYRGFLLATSRLSWATDLKLLTLSVRGGAFKNGGARGLHPPEQRVRTSQHWLAIYRRGYP